MRGSPVYRGFDHPATVAPVRLVHVLSSIDIRDESSREGDREPNHTDRSGYLECDPGKTHRTHGNPNHEGHLPEPFGAHDQRV